MNIDKLRKMIHFESDTCRTAELAALFMQRTASVDPVEALDTEQASGATVYPVATFPLSIQLAGRLRGPCASSRPGRPRPSRRRRRPRRRCRRR